MNMSIPESIETSTRTSHTAALDADRVEEELTRMIVTLELAPGASVTHAYLAERLNCGKMPLREALQRLIIAGLVVHSPNRGVSIAPLDIALYGSVMDTYIVLLSFAVRSAAQRATPAQITQLEEEVSEFSPLPKEYDIEEIMLGALRFQTHIAEFSGNEFLAKTIKPMVSIIFRYGVSYYLRNPNVPPVTEHLQDVVLAIRNRDGDTADQYIRKFLQKVRERLVKGLINPQLF